MSRPPWDDPDRGGLDSRTWLAIGLGLAVYYGWLLVFPPAPVAAEVATAAAEVTAEAPVVTPTAPVAASPTGDVGATVGASLCGARFEVDGTTGAVRDAVLEGHTSRYTVTPLYAWVLGAFDGAWQPYGPDPGPEVVISPDGLGLLVGAGPYAVSTAGVALGDGLTVRGAAGGLTWTRALREVRGDDGVCRVEAEITWSNPGGAAVSAELWVAMSDVTREAASRTEEVPHPLALVDGDLVAQAEGLPPGEQEAYEGPVDFFGVGDRYFAALLATGEPGEPGRGSLRFIGSATHQAAVYTVQRALAPGESYQERFKVYLGPKALEPMEQADTRLSASVDFGFFAVFALALLWILRAIHGVIGDWALSIIALVFLVKAAFYRLTQRSFESSQAMQELQPEVKSLQEQFKENPEELNRRMLALWQERGVNPMSGCLPMLVQTPVWIALYSALWSSVELYHAPFLWLKDLTEVDPYLVLPTAVTMMMVAQQQMMPTSGMSPEQAQMMRWMPVIFGVFFYTLPSGLVLYIFVNTLLSIVQQWYIRRTFSLKPKAAGATA